MVSSTLESVLDTAARAVVPSFWHHRVDMRKTIFPMDQVVGDLGSIPGLGRSPRERKGYQLQYSGLENSMDYIVHGVAKCWTQLSDFHFTMTL